MFKLAFTLSIIILISVSPSLTAQSISCSSCHNDPAVTIREFQKPGAAAERAIGIMDKGQISNYIGNYGVISHYLEYLNDAFHWPSSANDEVQYSFGLGPVVAVKGNVITSVIGGFAEKVDWVPKNGSRGRIFSGDVTAPPPDLTPFMAMSDNPETWPAGYYDGGGNWVSTSGERHWPGHFRLDVDPNSPAYGQEVPNQFVSDRDIYAVFDDSQNFHQDGSVGIEVEQNAYSYGRPYAEDILIFEYTIHNKSGHQLDSVYVGYYAVFRPDFDFQDYLNIIDSDPGDEHSNGDFVYVWDKNNIKDGPWEGGDAELGIIGLNVMETPHNMGVTDFHFFNREVAPKEDEKMWPVICSNPDDPNLDLPEAFFHGENRRMDNTDLSLLQSIFPDGAPLNYYIMTGPFSMAPDEWVKSSIAIVMGSSGEIPNQPDTTDLMANLRTARKMYQRKYQGSGPPKTPILKAHAGDGYVRLAWDSEAENSVDVLTGKKDFEGYKIYRSTDQGQTWGDPITDAYGTVIGYKPIKIFDLIDGVSGTDPAFNQSLGSESGIQHGYIDENLINGIEYWYCVTAYDKGNQNPDSLEQSYQSALGHSTMESHTVSVVPGSEPQNYHSSSVPAGSLEPIGGLCNGTVYVDIIQPEEITGEDYLITFTDSTLEISGTDTSYVWGFNLYRISKSTGDTTTVLYRHPFSDESGDNLPVTDGFRLTVQNSPSGISSIGWTKVYGDTCTFDWTTKPAEKYIGNVQTIQEEVYTIDDYQITIDTTASGGLMAQWYDYFTGQVQDSIHHLPLKVEVITDPDNPIDVSDNTWLIELAINAPWETYRINYYSPLGWDMIPGGKGYTPASPGFYEKYPDVINLERVEIDEISDDTTYSGLYLRTNNFPDNYFNADGEPVYRPAVAPSQGDEFTIRTYKPFRKEITYSFSTTATRFTEEKIKLDEIRVVPNPYIVSNSYESAQFEKKLMFNHLPDRCDIAIYNVAGDHITTIHHDDGRGFEFWDMRTKNDQFIAYGLYVYVVKMPNGQKKTGKFLVIK